MKSIMDAAWNLLNIKIILYGYELTIWNVILYFLVMYVLLMLIFQKREG